MTKFAVVEDKFYYKGHECICTFNRLGVRCGYVSVHTKKHHTDYNISCHCGLSFGADKLSDECSPSEEYYIGFDCGHICDGQDLQQAKEYGLIGNTEYKLMSGILSLGNSAKMPIRSLEYVKNQCKSIVDQLEEV